jgi:hypothetical protein
LPRRQPVLLRASLLRRRYALHQPSTPNAFFAIDEVCHILRSVTCAKSRQSLQRPAEAGLFLIRCPSTWYSPAITRLLAAVGLAVFFLARGFLLLMTTTEPVLSQSMAAPSSTNA